MNGAYILSQLWKGPPHISDISTTDGCNFHSDRPHPWLSYFHPLTLFSLSRSLSSCFTFALFWVSALGYSMLSVPSASFRLVSFLLFPTFCLFALFLQFITFFRPSILTITSHLRAIFLLKSLSPPELSSCFCFCLSISHLSSLFLIC